MRKLTFLLIALLLMAVPAFAQDDADTSFDTLLAAVEAAGLTETLASEGPFTVFAPTDDAFAAALEALGISAEDLLADTETLTGILTYHVVAGEIMAANVVALIEGAEDGSADVETLNGATFSVALDGATPVINESANVIQTDVEASNGVIHIIDAVLLPPSDDMMAEAMSDDMSEDMAEGDMAEDMGDDMMSEDMAEMGTIVDIAADAEDFSTLVSAVTAAELVETLSGEGPFTVFAPTNDAFAAALEALGLTAEELLADTETLTPILTYHVVASDVMAADVVAIV
ncbi:MAG: fasciclin domain-containing protein, partial [Chloroflexota bacterium]